MRPNRTPPVWGNPSHSLVGSTLLVVVIFTALLSILLLSYLHMVNNSNYLTARSLSWNQALPVAEAGIEEAASAIRMAPTNQLLSAALQADGWTLTGNQLTKRRQLTNAYYTGLITSTNPARAISPSNPPVVYSTGYVAAPYQRGYIGRIVKVGTVFYRTWGSALLSQSTIEFGGTPSVVDSFDSSDPAHSTGGLYDPAKRTDHAQVACYSSSAGCVSVGAGAIYGYVNTQPGATITIGGNGAVGDLAFVSTNKGEIQLGHVRSDLAAAFPSVEVPFTSGSSLYAAKIGGVNYAYVADTGNYYRNNDLKMVGGAAMLVRGNALVYVTGSVSLGSQCYIKIMPGASLTLVVGGPSCTLSGGGIINDTETAANCSILCLPTCTSGAYSGGAAFIGTIYAPDTDWSLTGGAGVCGALTAKSIKVAGGMNVHYDEALLKKPDGFYGIRSWEEL